MAESTPLSAALEEYSRRDPNQTAQPNAHDPETARPRIGSAAFWTQLAASENHWIWKTSLRAALIVADLVAIALGAVVIAQSNFGGDYAASIGYTGDNWAGVPAVAVCGVSLLWCAIYLLLLFFRHPPRPPLPGLAVAFDLLLFIFLLICGLVALTAYYSIIYFGEDGLITDFFSEDYNRDYSGQYTLNKNGTWIYHITYINPYDAPAGTTIHNVHRTCAPQFTSCAQQDALVNALWRQKDGREARDLLLAAALWIGMIVHFVLFVWACVDTHRRRRRSNARRKRVVAEEVVRDLAAKGLITVHPHPQSGTGVLAAQGGDKGVGSVLESQRLREQAQPLLSQPPAPEMREGTAAPEVAARDPDVIEAVPRR